MNINFWREANNAAQRVQDVLKAPAPPPHSHKSNREGYLVILSTVDRFINTAIATIENHVDPHDKRALTTFFLKMARDNVVKSNLPKYAAGTGFAKTLNALTTLSAAAAKRARPKWHKP